MASWRPFSVQLTMATPICGDSRPTGDAIFVGETMIQYDEAYAMAALGDHVRRTDDVPHASIALLDGIMASGSTVCVALLRREWASIDPDSISGRLMRQSASGGPPALTSRGVTYQSENLFNRYPTVTTPLIMFQMVGDIDVLRDVFTNLWAIGKRRNAGWGRVSDVEIIEVDQNPDTWGLIDLANNPVRPMPLDLFRRLVGRDPELMYNARARPLYWSDSVPMELCAMPTSSLLEDFVF